MSFSFKSFLSSSLFNTLSSAVLVIYSMLIASLFGATADMDTYVAATSITIAINALLNNSQSNTLIPFLAGKDDKNKTLSKVINFNFTLSLSLTLLVVILSPLIIRVIAPGLSATQQQQSSLLLRILSINILFTNIGALGSAILKLDNKISTTYFFGFLGTLTLFILLYTIKDRFGVYVFPLIQLISGIPFLIYNFILFKKKGISFHPIKEFDKSVISEYSKLLIPVLTGWLFVWIIKFTDNNIASRFQTGSMSYLSYCTKILNFAILIPNIICGMTFPILSKLAQNNSSTEYAKSFKDGFKKLLILIIPICLIIFLFSRSIVLLMYQRGSFTPHDTNNVALLIKGYIFVIVCAPIGSYFANAFFAFKKPKTAMKISITSSLTNVVLNIALSQIWGVLGLVIASSIAFLLGNVLQSYFLKKVNPILTVKSLLLANRKVLLSLVVVLLVGLFSEPLLTDWINLYISNRHYSNIAILILGSACTAFLFFIMLLIQKEVLALKISQKVFSYLPFKKR